MNFLIDECLHPSLVEVAIGRGYEATHITYRGLGGVQDWNLMGPIRDGGFTFVTNNARDFRKLYAREEVHAGLIILIPNAPPALQRILFAAVLEEIASEGGMINEAIEVAVVDGEIEIVRYALP